MTETDEKPKRPVTISGEATRALAFKMREWSGWPKASLVWGKPMVSPHAETEHVTKTFTVNPEGLILNPNRALLTVTPFRLRQEAVLTGTLLHEAAHARHTHWKPRTEEQLAEFKHSDGEKVSAAAFALASLMEEPRIEAIMATEADQIGAFGLAWTMRAMAAHLLPLTEVSADPNVALMQTLDSWALRAGRQIGLQQRTGRSVPSWVHDFTSLLHGAVVNHLAAVGDADPKSHATVIQANLLEMIGCNDDDGPTMVDLAREVMTMLFPETDADDQPQASGGCAMPMAGEESESGEGSSQPSEGDESDEQGEGGTSAPEEDDEPSDGDSEGEGDSASGSTEESEGGSESESEGEGEGEGESEPTPEQQAQQQALSAMEHKAKTAVEAEGKSEAEAQPQMEPGSGAGNGRGGGMGGGFRLPSAQEREVQKNAGRFLRNLIDGAERSKVTLSETPSATIDPAAHAAWKAGGQVREPHFFLRTRREVQPTPPVRIAILVDISSSMGQLQRPSALLSWALASAAVDLRNFAGRGVQIESTLIHWGFYARVIQRNGEMLPGIREVPCDEGTTAMDEALGLVEEQMPGFLDGDPNGKPVNRLLVQFTDWELMSTCANRTTPLVSRALASGVNMVSVVPQDFSPRYSALGDILGKSPVQRGISSVMKYNRNHPEQVWDHTAEVLSGKRPAPFAGF